jgi:TolB-like protein/Flp pilus assembly protein TadD
MATVYLALDLRHGRPVALKVLRPDLPHPLAAERFLREIAVVAGLTHPHIVPLHDSGEEAGLLWYAMPYIEGESLRNRLRRDGSLPLDEAIRLAREVADALGYAHGRGIIHRDLKPENILLLAGHALVADFGIARALSTASSERLTETGLTLGTPHYMSPEQAAGDHEVDGRSDIYALGCVLYELLAGAPPFTGPSPEAVLIKRFTEAPPSLRSIRDGIPEATQVAIEKALARVPADRFETAMEFARALSRSTQAISGLETTVSTRPAPAKSIAVLPFADMSPLRDQEYFADGLAEEIIGALTRIEALRVASRTASFAFKGRNEEIGDIARKLRVGTLLEGSVRKAGNRLRVTAQLVNAVDGYHLWSEHYDRELEDVFAIQDEIAANVVRAMQVVMNETAKRALDKPRTGNVQAYEYYLRGRQLFHQFREKGLQMARRMFARAIEIDHTFVLAYAGLADCSSMLYTYWHARPEDLEQADAASRTALDMGPDVAEAHAARGLALTLRGAYDAAADEFVAAIRLDPRLFEAYYFYARACFQAGRLAEAAQLFEQAAAVRPEDYQAVSLLEMVYHGLGRMEEAETAQRRATKAIEEHLDLNPGDARAWCLGAVNLTRLGEPEKALQWANHALELDPEEGAIYYNAACVHAIQGKHEQAVDLLEAATEKGYRKPREWVQNDSDLRSLRDVERFRSYLERL